MCYSAQLEMKLSNLKKTERARVAVQAFEKVFEARLTDDSIKIPKALEANFYHPQSKDEERVRQLIETFHGQKTQKLEAELFKQKKRLAAAERSLMLKATKTATNDQRIASHKIPWLIDRIQELKRTTLDESDSRIYPFQYAPVVIMEDGERVIRPMRYHCRPAGKPASYDSEYDRLYNARRDNLEGFWKKQFGHTQAYVVMSRFYENVALNDFEHRELAPDEKFKNLILCFNPRPRFDMRVACLWSRWHKSGEPDLESFAAITDEPPPEVAASGHNRCIIPIKEKNLDTWLQPNSANLGDLYAVLDDRERPYYEHQWAA